MAAEPFSRLRKNSAYTYNTVGILQMARKIPSRQDVKMAPILTRPSQCAETHRSTGTAEAIEEARRYIPSFA